MCIFGYSGGPGWPINNRTGPILLPRHPLTYINLHIKIWKQSDKDFLSYRENDEVSADADADAAAERRLNHSIPRTYFVRGIQLTVTISDNHIHAIYTVHVLD